MIRAYRQDLDQRETKAKAAERCFPQALYLALYRPTEVSLQCYYLTSRKGLATGQPWPSCTHL